MDSDVENENFEHLYNEDDANKHSKLVEKVLSLNKVQNLKKPSRTEPTLQISEFNLVKSSDGNAEGSIELTKLTKALKDKRSRLKINENLKRINSKSQTLPKPLEKPQADRIRRSVAYEKVCLDLDKWESVVTSNRVSTNLKFPMENETKMEKKKEIEDFTSKWRIKSELEQELEKLNTKVETYDINLEEKEEFPLTMKEMMARRKEAAKLRAFQGYKEAKARRQNKIKSKKYHRIQKKMKIKQKLKEFEQLQKTDPEAALEKLEEIEKARVLERMSLRHKSTGKWAKSKQIRAKYDKSTRQELSEQLKIAKELTNKVNKNESDESDEEITNGESVVLDKNNPWLNEAKMDEELSSFVNNYRKFWTEHNKLNKENVNGNDEIEEKSIEQEEIKETDNKITKKEEEQVENDNETEKIKDMNEKKTKEKQKKVKKSKKSDLNQSQSTSEWDVSIVDKDNTTQIEDLFNKAEKKLTKKMFKNVKSIKRELNKQESKQKPAKKKQKQEKIDYLTMKSTVKKPIIDEAMQEEPYKNPENDENSLNRLKSIISSTNSNQPTNNNIDPNTFIRKNVEPKQLSTSLPDLIIEDDNEETEKTNQRELISEAFEDDDLIEDFTKSKQEEIDKNKPQNIDLSLPGWGCWGGTNIIPSKRKKKRFIIKTPKVIPRRDDNKGTLIINENANAKLKEHMVTEIPFPFKTVKDFEASIRSPIGNTFVPETAFRKFIKPSVETKMGKIIEPISKDLLLAK